MISLDFSASSQRRHAEFACGGAIPDVIIDVVNARRDDENLGQVAGILWMLFAVMARLASIGLPDRGCDVAVAQTCESCF